VLVDFLTRDSLVKAWKVGSKNIFMAHGIDLKGSMAFSEGGMTTKVVGGPILGYRYKEVSLDEIIKLYQTERSLTFDIVP